MEWCGGVRNTIAGMAAGIMAGITAGMTVASSQLASLVKLGGAAKSPGHPRAAAPCFRHPGGPPSSLLLLRYCAVSCCCSTVPP